MKKAAGAKLPDAVLAADFDSLHIVSTWPLNDGSVINFV